jgi:hypothetical protein
MGDNRLPLEQRIGSVRDGDTTDHDTPIRSTPLAVQPQRKPDMDDTKQDHAPNVTETDGNITAVGDIVDGQTPHLLVGDNSQTPHLLGRDIVDRLTTLFWQMKDEGKVQAKNTVANAIAEIERLQNELAENPSISNPDSTHMTQMVENHTNPAIGQI